MPRNALADRVKELIDTFHDGNVLDAARLTGVPHQTLTRIVKGLFKQSPRADALQAIASKYPGVTVDWLLSGQGQGPRKVDAEGRPITAARLRWEAIEKRILAAFDEAPGNSPAESGLSRTNERKLLEHGLGMLTIVPFVVSALVPMPAGDDRRHAMQRREHFHAALDNAAQFWAELFEGLIQIEGADRVVAALRKNLPHLLVGFSNRMFGDLLKKQPGGLRSYAELLRRDEAKDSPQDSASS